MNRENLKRMADYIATVPQESFDMEDFRSGGRSTRECNSVGCIIGHCTKLDTPKNIGRFMHSKTKEIFFMSWSEFFTGIQNHQKEWDWLFSSQWSEVDNTTQGAAARIRYLLEHGLPEDWEMQMDGKAPLCYLNVEETQTK